MSKSETRLDFLSPVERLPGIGGKRAAALRSSGVCTVGDLLYRIPIRYIDRREITPISELSNCIGSECCIIGRVSATRVEKGRRTKFRIKVEDDSGSIEALWFNGIGFLRKTILKGYEVLLHGKITSFGKPQMVHPSVEKLGKAGVSGIRPWLPVYSISMDMKSAGIGQKTLVKCYEWLLNNLRHYPRVLPEGIEKECGLPKLAESLRKLHFPEDFSDHKSCLKRLKYEEMYRIVLLVKWNRRKFQCPGRSMLPGTMYESLKSMLPFELTDGQKSAVDAFYKDSAKAERMHRILIGDVGCGKTITGLFAMLPALNSGHQDVWLSPTSILAEQTYRTVSLYLRKLGVECVLFTGSLSAERKREIRTGLSSGSLQAVVGTHALITDSVSFASLGMSIIDEQHRFGTEQRMKVIQKDEHSDFMLMTATPIPRSFMQTMYGDLEPVEIRSEPAGRGDISTHLVPEPKREEMKGFVLKEIEEGAQVYWIVPRIEDEGGDTELFSVEGLYKELSQGSFRGVKKEIAYSGIEKSEGRLRAFREGEAKLLIATTVVEVGMDIPDASVIVIENPERYGLAQLHQMRGRIGRRGQRSYCLLPVHEGLSDSGLRRLKEFSRLRDGFKIAEADMRTRGPGTPEGLKQSGFGDMKFCSLPEDLDIFDALRSYIYASTDI